MLTKQQLIASDDGTIRLRNTFDCGAAATLAKETTKAGGGRFGSGSGECIMLGHIPPELWQCDPWLIAADNARKGGDMGEYTRYLKKFFEVYPAFAITTDRKYWHGLGAAR